MTNIDNEQQEFEKFCKAIYADNVWTVKEALKRFAHIQVKMSVVDLKELTDNLNNQFVDQPKGYAKFGKDSLELNLKEFLQDKKGKNTDS